MPFAQGGIEYMATGPCMYTVEALIMLRMKLVLQTIMLLVHIDGHWSPHPMESNALMR